MGRREPHGVQWIKFEQMRYGDTKNVGKGIYKTNTGQIIEVNKTEKDLVI